MSYRVVRNRFEVMEPYVKGKSVLDIGCVDARPDGLVKYKSSGLHIALSEHASRLVGLDLDEKGVKAMQEDGFEVVCADVERMKLGESFDCIVAGEVIEHLSNQGLFLEGVKEHLKDDGVFIATVPNAFAIPHFYRIARRGTVKVHGDHTCWYDPLTIGQLFRRHGLKVDEIVFANKSKWYKRRYFFKLKYQLPKLFTWLRPYFSGMVIVVARKERASAP